MSRGGKRPGTGPKKKEPTKRMSIPETIFPEIKGIVDKYSLKGLKPKDK
jgi:hypothetical protein